MSETTIYKEGFNAGFMQLRQIDVEAATKELWQAETDAMAEDDDTDEKKE